MKMDLSAVRERFRLAISQYSDAVKLNRGPGTHKTSDVIEECFVQFRDCGSEGLDIVAEFLHSPDDVQRYWASCLLLDYPQYNSLPVVEELVESDGVIALFAQVSLSAWRSAKKGSLQQEVSGHRPNQKLTRYNLDAFPFEMKWEEIEDFDQFDERCSAVNCLFQNIVGVCEGYVEWCPNDDPPSQDESLAWVWSVRPSTAEKIADRGDANLRSLIASYKADDMESWWMKMASSEE